MSSSRPRLPTERPGMARRRHTCASPTRQDDVGPAPARGCTRRSWTRRSWRDAPRSEVRLPRHTTSESANFRSRSEDPIRRSEREGAIIVSFERRRELTPSSPGLKALLGPSETRRGLMALRSAARIAARRRWAAARPGGKLSVRSASAVADTDSEVPWSTQPIAQVPDYDGWDVSLEGDFTPRRQTTAATFHAAEQPRADPRAGICDSVLELVGQTPMVRGHGGVSVCGVLT